MLPKLVISCKKSKFLYEFVIQGDVAMLANRTARDMQNKEIFSYI